MLPHVHLPEQASPMQAKMSHLLEKALGVATQHNLVAFKQWVERELDGYPPSVAIPEYRCVPVEITSPALAEGSCFKTPEQFAQCYVPHSMPDIEKIVAESDPHSLRKFPLPPDMLNDLKEQYPMACDGEPTLAVQVCAFASIIEAVRSELLYWCLTLRQRGIP